MEFLKAEKEKNKKLSTALNKQTKNLADLKKKNDSIEGTNKEIQKKMSETETKIFKLKELLRKK